MMITPTGRVSSLNWAAMAFASYVTCTANVHLHFECTMKAEEPGSQKKLNLIILVISINQSVIVSSKASEMLCAKTMSVLLAIKLLVSHLAVLGFVVLEVGDCRPAYTRYHCRWICRIVESSLSLTPGTDWLRQSGIRLIATFSTRRLAAEKRADLQDTGSHTSPRFCRCARLAREIQFVMLRRQGSEFSTKRCDLSQREQPQNAGTITQPGFPPLRRFILQSCFRGVLSLACLFSVGLCSRTLAPFPCHSEACR